MVLGTNAHLYTGQVTVNTTRAQITSSFKALANGVIVKAPSSNGASVYIGLNTVTTANGDILEPGESRGYPVSNLNLLYVISVASMTDIISYEGN